MRPIGIFVTGVIVVLGAVLVASLASADDESDRRSILSDIESKLGSAASELSGVKSDSDDGDIPVSHGSETGGTGSYGI